NYLAARIAAGEARFFVAMDGAVVVGTSGALISDGYPFAVHRVARGYIFGVRVAPEYRRRGLARRLTEAGIAFLRGAGCTRIRLHASPFGRPIYERLGFTPTNEMELRP
ncbi:MAG TPA: GNAT family N-acetyltransferase, partial [Candidatus Acidoferrales bacterium]|nr:GNAT family N-acetyltransferase [Candidatus Acidoferrales bacterium]